MILVEINDDEVKKIPVIMLYQLMLLTVLIVLSVKFSFLYSLFLLFNFSHYRIYLCLTLHFEVELPLYLVFCYSFLCWILNRRLLYFFFYYCWILEEVVCYTFGRILANDCQIEFSFVVGRCPWKKRNCTALCWYELTDRCSKYFVVFSNRVTFTYSHSKIA